MKSGAQTMNDVSKIVLNIDAALFGESMHNSLFHQSSSVPTPMEIGNVQQRPNDRNNNSCFKYHKTGYRTCKCGTPRDKNVTKTKIGSTSAENWSTDGVLES